MGKIRNKTVKNVARKIFRMYPDRISGDFENNKKEIEDIAQIPSKKLRNKIAGYLVNLYKIKERASKSRKKPESDK